MAIIRLKKDGYGQLELNFAAFRRSGNIVANKTFADGQLIGKDYPIENGMVLFVNETINPQIELPLVKTMDISDPSRPTQVVSDRMTTDGQGYFALNYTAEHLYDEREQGLKNFAIFSADEYPRLGILHDRDTFTTNTVCWDTEEFANYTDGKEVPFGAKYGVPHRDGYIRLVEELPEKCDFVLAVRDRKATMPDGQPAVKFVKVGGTH